MDGYLLDTNAASILWDMRHREYKTLRSFIQKNEQSPFWISIVVFGEIEYGLKTALLYPEQAQSLWHTRRTQAGSLPV